VERGRDGTGRGGEKKEEGRERERRKGMGGLGG